MQPNQSECSISNLDQSDCSILYYVTSKLRICFLRSGTKFGGPGPSAVNMETRLRGLDLSATYMEARLVPEVTSSKRK